MLFITGMIRTHK